MANQAIKVGAQVNILHCGYVIGVVGKPETEVYDVIKVGTKRIECTNHKGRKGFFAYHVETDTAWKTYKLI